MSEPARASAHQAPEGASDKTVEGVGKLSEAFEYVERARGHLYSFHQLTGRADFLVEEAAGLLREAGHEELARRLDEELVGRNVLDGRWTFQVVEEFDELYYRVIGDEVRALEQEFHGGRRHVFESQMKEQRRTRGKQGHERRPPSAAGPEVVMD